MLNNNFVQNKYFGTDGFRGQANVELTSLHAYKVGRFLGWYYSSQLSGCMKNNYKPKIIIGKDTRLSSYMLEYSLVAGITSSGADAYLLHVTTTPSVSYITRQDKFDCGVMITASHNPFYDNGIKIISNFGEKLDDKTTSYIEAYIDKKYDYIGISDDLPLATGKNMGKIVDYVAGRNRYIGYLVSVASNSYKNLKIGLDCANGASWTIAKAVFDALGASTYLIGDSPDGVNINDNVGSTHVENLCALVKNNHLDVGFAFDGDADRCIAVDENGRVVDGDGILYILAKRLKSRQMLDLNRVVITQMSNSGLVKSLEKDNISCVRTEVGDRFVYECMQSNGYKLGGEQSGHIIIQKYATTGDGLLTAIMLTEQLCDEKSTLSQLVKNYIKLPQFEVSITVKDKNIVFEDCEVIEKYNETKNLIGSDGRIVLRKSGTEPVVRIMAEHESIDKCKEYVLSLYEIINKKGNAID